MIYKYLTKIFTLAKGISANYSNICCFETQKTPGTHREIFVVPICSMDSPVSRKIITKS